MSSVVHMAYVMLPTNSRYLFGSKGVLPPKLRFCSEGVALGLQFVIAKTFEVQCLVMSLIHPDKTIPLLRVNS